MTGVDRKRLQAVHAWFLTIGIHNNAFEFTNTADGLLAFGIAPDDGEITEIAVWPRHGRCWEELPPLLHAEAAAIILRGMNE